MQLSNDAVPPSTVIAAARTQPLRDSEPPPVTDSAAAKLTLLSDSDPNCSTENPPVPQAGAAASD